MAAEQRSMEEIYGGAAPLKTGDRYRKAWGDFEAFVGRGEDFVAVEEDFAKYFDYLRGTKHMMSSTLWTEYSKLNNCYQRRYVLNNM